MTETTESTRDELARRHRAAALSVIGAFAFTIALMFIATVRLYLASLRPKSFRELVSEVLGGSPPLGYDPTLVGALWISIIFFGIGAVVLRRTKFSAMRLQAVASVRGTSGLLETLQKTTVLIALIGCAIGVMGFVVTLMSGEAGFMLYTVAIAIAVLFYAYPRRAAWERVVQLTTPGETAPASPAKGTFS